MVPIVILLATAFGYGFAEAGGGAVMQTMINHIGHATKKTTMTLTHPIRHPKHDVRQSIKWIKGTNTVESNPEPL